MKITPLLVSLAALMAAPLNAQSLVGSWSIKNAGQARSSAVLTFLADGSYIMAEDGDRNLDSSGRDGMERGTYQWNPSNKAFSVKTLVDTSGEWGLSNANFKTASVKGTALTIVDEDGSFTLEQATSSNNPLIGGWYFKSPNGGYATVSFLADGSYFHAEDGTAGGGGKAGMERGTYQWNRSTLQFTRKVLVDTNGTWGLSDNLKRSISISGNKLTMTVAGEGKFVLSRAIAPKLPLITVQQPVGTTLKDSLGKKSFGTVVIGKSGTPKTFTIKNTGSATLTKLAITSDGAHKSNFPVGPLGATQLAPGATTTFKVGFKPTAKGTRTAAIHITSNDKRTGIFDIQLTGLGVTN